MKAIYKILSIALLTVLFPFSITGQVGPVDRNEIYIKDMSVVAGQRVYMPVMLESSMEIVALEFTLQLPDEIVISGQPVWSERRNGHEVAVRLTSANTYKIIAFSDENKAFRGRNGQIMSIPVDVSSSIREDIEYQAVITDAILSSRTGENLLTGTKVGVITVKPSPDIEISAVATDKSSYSPKDTMIVSWQVKNIGNEALQKGWTEQVSLIGDLGRNKEIATIQNQIGTAGFEAGEVRQSSATVVLPDVIGMDGDLKVVVRLNPYTYSGERDEYAYNNTDTTDFTVRIEKQLYLQLPIAVEEDLEGGVECKIIRSGNNLRKETFTLTADDSRLALPSSITIAAGNSAAFFTMSLNNNTILDESNSATVTAQGGSYSPVTAVVLIEDDEHPLLAVTPDKTEITEGDTVILTISTDKPVAADLPVQLLLSTTNVFDSPNSVVLPAGQSAVIVKLASINDDNPQMVRNVSVSAVAEGYDSQDVRITVLDDDLPDLHLSFSPNKVSENRTVVATVKRTGKTDNKIRVDLYDGTSELFYTMKSVVMDPGVKEVKVLLIPNDNEIADGMREVLVTAAVRIPSCDCNVTEGKGRTVAPLTIIDDDGLALRFGSSEYTLLEGSPEGVRIKIRRTEISPFPLEVSLSCDNPEGLTYPDKVIIPENERQTEFTITSAKNTIENDDHTVVFEATAAGYTQAVASVLVTDRTYPDAQVADLQIDKTQVTALTEEFTVTVTVANTGIIDLPAATPVSISVGSTDTIVYTTTSIHPEGTEVLTIAMPAQKTVGTYTVVAIVNPKNAIKEINYINNNSSYTAKSVSLTVLPPFTASLTTDKSLYCIGETIHIEGSVEGALTANQQVEVYTINRGYRNVQSVTTDASGHFEATWEILSGQYGHFSIGACYPAENLTQEMAGIEVMEMRLKENVTCYVIQSQPFVSGIKFSNLSDIPLTNIRATVQSELPEDVQVVFEPLDNIGGKEISTLNFTLTCGHVSTSNAWETIDVLLSSDEGATMKATVYFFAQTAKGSLFVDIDMIKTTVAEDAVFDYSFTLYNSGNGSTGDISFSLPSFMTPVGPLTLPAIEPLENRTVTLRITPTDEMNLNIPVTGRIGINPENGYGLALPFSVEKVSENKGTLTVDVCDGYTYYAAEKPHVKGVEVLVTHPTTGAEVARGTTGEDGQFSVELPAGYYDVMLFEEKHETKDLSVFVEAGKETFQSVIMNISAIKITWNVVETEVEDVYEITSTIIYETRVPVPVVVLTLPKQLPIDSLEYGESFDFVAELTNHGLITALSTQLFLPADAEELTFEALAFDEPFDLPAGQTVYIPIRMTKTQQAAQTSAPRKEPQSDRSGSGGSGCLPLRFNTICYYKCGFHLQPVGGGNSIPSPKKGCTLSDPSYIPQGDTNSGLPTPMAPGGVPNGVFEGENSNPGPPYKPVCNECLDNLFTKELSCVAKVGSNFVPVIKEILDLMDLMNCLESVAKLIYDEIDENASGDMILQYLNKIGQGVAVMNCILSKVPGIEQVYAAGDIIQTCIFPLFDPCLWKGNNSGVSGAARVRSKTNKNMVTHLYNEEDFSDFPSYVKQYLKTIDILSSAINASIAFKLEVYGDSLFLVSDSFEQQALADYLMVWDGNSPDIYTKKPSNVSDELFERFVERWHNHLFDVDSANKPDKDVIKNNLSLMIEAHLYADMYGYSSLAEMYEEVDKQYQQQKEENTSSGVCASVTLQLSQSMVMTRQAFRGYLSVNNGSDTESMKGVKLTLRVRNTETNEYATSHEFQINPETLTGFTGELDLESGWELAPGADGMATILFIPTKYAAPDHDVRYSFSGSLSYVDPFTGLRVDRILLPQTLTVSPSPNLRLDYFMQRDIVGDDPMTEDVIEPQEEAEFALLINNVGAGAAKNLKMTTRQPEITENEKGLLINFELVRSMQNGKQVNLSLDSTIVNDFGTIPAHSTTYAQWYLTSTLWGHFISYNTTVKHVSSYGNASLSLIDTVRIHEMIRGVGVPATTGDIRGWIVNDMEDAYDLPDRIYRSDGTRDVVRYTADVEMRATNEANKYLLVVNADTACWTYGYANDITYGKSRIDKVVRQSDGKQLCTDNFWMTDRTLRDGNSPLYEDRIHFADSLTRLSEVYTVYTKPKIELAVNAVEGVPVALSDTFVTNIMVVFNKGVLPESFTPQAVKVTCEGNLLLSDDVVITALSADTFALDVSLLTNKNGYYTLAILTDKLTDADGFAGKKNDPNNTVSWTQYLDNMVKVDVIVVPENSGTVTPEVHNAQYGSNITLTASPAEGYEFEYWSTPTDITLGKKTVYQTAALKDLRLYAHFLTMQHRVNISSSDERMGTVTGAVNGEFDHASQLTLLAVPEPNCQFAGWSDGVTEPDRTVVITSDTTLTAMFTSDYRTLTAATCKHGHVEGAGSYPIGAEATLTAVPDAGYHFAKWVNDTINLTSSYTLTVTDYLTVGAVFEPDVYNITYGNLFDAYHLNPSTYTIEDCFGFKPAMSRTGFVFAQWNNENGDLVTSIEAGTTGDLVLNAVWTPASYYIRYQYANGDLISGPNNRASYTIEDEFLFAAPGTRYGIEFVEWRDEDGNPVTGITAGSNGNRIITGIFREALEDEEVVDPMAIPGTTSVTVTWPIVDDATYYTVTISEDYSSTVCTLIFDAWGRLNTARYARGNDANRQPRATQINRGWRYTITDLKPDTEYTYNVTVVTGNNSVIYDETVPFRTNAVPTYFDEIMGSQTPSVQKIIRNGTLYIIRDGKVYTATGAEVR